MGFAMNIKRSSADVFFKFNYVPGITYQVEYFSSAFPSSV